MIFFYLVLINVLTDFSYTEMSQFCNTFTNTLNVKNFDNFSYLNVSSCFLNESALRLIPKVNLILNNDLIVDLKEKKFRSLNGIEIFYLKGIDVSSSMFGYYPYKPFPICFNIKNSKFMFYYKNKMISENDCDSGEIYDSFYSLFYYVPGTLTLMDCIYPETICILAFKNARIKYLTFNNLFSSSVKKNYLKFSKKSGLNFSLNSDVINVQFNEFYRINFDSSILNEQVFKLVKYIYLYGSINKIQIDLFYKFDFIEGVAFQLYNLKQFVHLGLNWTNYLRNNATKIEIGLYNYEKLLSSLYDYPNEDWCLFKDAIDNKRISLYSEDYNSYTNLSCVLIGFLKNRNLDELVKNEWYKTCCIDDPSILIKMLNNCSKIYKCSFDEVDKNISDQTFDYYELVQLVYNFDFFFEFIIEPVVIIFGILANCLVIYVLKSKNNRKDFLEKMYSYIFYNSVFNLMILLLDLIGYIYKCSLNGFGYCPRIRETIVVQYIFILINFMQNFFGFCSNMSMLLFSIERFTKVINNSSKRLDKFLKYFDKFYLSILFSLGFIINLCKLFEYKANSLYDSLNFPDQLEVEDFNSQLFCLMFFLLLISSQFLSNFLIQILNLLIDIIMFVKYKNIVKERAKIESTITSLRKKETLTSNKLLRMIISFASVNFLLRLPEIVVFCVLKYYQLTFSNKRFLYFKLNQYIKFSNMEYYCYNRKNCEKILKGFQVLFKVSFLLNIFILYFMNKIFRNKVKSLAFKLKK